MNNKFDVYRAYNLPMPLLNTNKKVNMIAKFQLETDYIAVDSGKSKFILLDSEEINKCTNPFVDFCDISSPTYQINLSKLCVTTLFMKKGRNIDRDCRTMVMPNSPLPIAKYISSGSWITTTNENINFEMCVSQSYDSQA